PEKRREEELLPPQACGGRAQIGCGPNSGKRDPQEVKETKPKLPQPLSGGDNLIWPQTHEGALFSAKTKDGPRSQTLKKVFAEHKEMQKLAEKFVLSQLVFALAWDNMVMVGGQFPEQQEQLVVKNQLYLVPKFLPSKLGVVRAESATGTSLDSGTS
uniref:Uncharacterized protein n=1 Tax=Terrapene triunguis TaxID=2587831 RepID=A0A674IIV9_9SAUR